MRRDRESAAVQINELECSREKRGDIICRENQGEPDSDMDGDASDSPTDQHTFIHTDNSAITLIRDQINMTGCITFLPVP